MRFCLNFPLFALTLGLGITHPLAYAEESSSLFPFTLFEEKVTKPEPLPEMDLNALSLPPVQATVRVLDKRLNHIEDIQLSSKEETLFEEKWLFSVKQCFANKQSQDDIAWIRMRPVEEGDEEQKAIASLFEGWLYANHPTYSGLEHPRYDIRLLTCDVIKSEPEDQ